MIRALALFAPTKVIRFVLSLLGRRADAVRPGLSPSPRVLCVASPGESPDPPAEEERLIRAAQKGDRPAFAALVEHYWDRLYRWLYRMTHDRHAAEDLTQETFLKAFAGLNRFQAGTNFAAWLFRIAHNNFANGRRAKGRQRQPLPDDLAAKDGDPVEEAQSCEALAIWHTPWIGCRRNFGRPCYCAWNKNCRSVRSPMFSD